MKTLLFLLSIPLIAQTVSVGGIANTPDSTAAISQWIIAQTAGTPTPTTAAIAIGDTTVALPAAIASGCLESYAMVTLTSASNVSTTNASTYNVPLGTQVTVSNSLTPAYNAIFATTSAPSTSAGLTWALTIADGNYANTNPTTNGYPVLTYNHCAVLIDSEVIEVTGYNGTTYTANRASLGTTAAAHALGANMTPLKYSGLRGLFRANAQSLVGQILQTTVTPAIAAQQAIIAAAQAQILKLQKASGQ